MKFSKVLQWATFLAVLQGFVSACGSSSDSNIEVSNHQKALEEFDAMASTISIGSSCSIQIKEDALSVTGDQEKTYNFVNKSATPEIVIPFSLPVSDATGSLKAERGGAPQYWRVDWVDDQSQSALQSSRPVELRWSVDETIQKTTEFSLKTPVGSPLSLTDCN